MDETLLKKYIPMTETTYYTLLAVTKVRHGYAIMQFVSELTKGRIQLGTGTLYTMVGRLVSDGVIRIVASEDNKKSYLITEVGMEILKLESIRLGNQLEDGKLVISEQKNEVGGESDV
ncbi:PadR family transcriptional regulator [Lachnospiraceae bacterium OttesenSCG-928-D06]|nr:PadR family transcriptional regulator [Lachnospiraceae bacterium OttesenSCG-928-D06]